MRVARIMKEIAIVMLVRHVSHLLPPQTTNLMGRYKEGLAIMQMWGWMLADCSGSESKYEMRRLSER